MAAFKKGNVVMLKSGGPAMTVTDIGDYSAGMGAGPEDGVKCVWFDDKKNPVERVFDAAVLEIA